MSRGHRQIDHTADLALELWADSEEDLLVTAAQAVTEILIDGTEVADRAGRELTIDGIDAGDRLVQWVNGVIVAAVLDGFLFHGAAIELEGTSLTAHLRGEPDGHGRVVTELKSATYHDLVLESGPDGWRARIIIDV